MVGRGLVLEVATGHIHRLYAPKGVGRQHVADLEAMRPLPNHLNIVSPRSGGRPSVAAHFLGFDPAAMLHVEGNLRAIQRPGGRFGLAYKALHLAFATAVDVDDERLESLGRKAAAIADPN